MPIQISWVFPVPFTKSNAFHLLVELQYRKYSVTNCCFQQGRFVEYFVTTFALFFIFQRLSNFCEKMFYFSAETDEKAYFFCILLLHEDLFYQSYVFFANVGIF